MKRTPILATALALGALLTAYGCGQGPTSGDNAAAPQQTTSATSAPTQPAASTRKVAVDATALAAALKVGKVRTWTAEDDPNKKLGRPGGYTSAASVVDSRVECTDDVPGASCGATVEVFATAADAASRATYIDAGLKSIGDSEYHTVVGGALLRVTSGLTPKQAAVYAERFKAAATA